MTRTCACAWLAHVHVHGGQVCLVHMHVPAQAPHRLLVVSLREDAWQSHEGSDLARQRSRQEIVDPRAVGRKQLTDVG